MEKANGQVRYSRETRGAAFAHPAVRGLKAIKLTARKIERDLQLSTLKLFRGKIIIGLSSGMVKSVPDFGHSFPPMFHLGS